MTDFEVQWIEHTSNERPVLEKLGTDLGIHPLAIEDCLHANQRSKFDDFENHQLLVWFLYAGGEVYELEFVLFPHMVLLVTDGPPPSGKTWREFLNVGRTHRDGPHMLYQALDRATDISEANLGKLFELISEFEEHLFAGSGDPKHLMRHKRDLARAELALSSLSSVVAQWQRFQTPKDDLRWRLRDLLDHTERLHQRIVFHRLQIASTMDMYWGITAKRTNDQIKKLTLVASIAVPLSFWTSFWGMNFTHLPFDKPWAMPFAFGAMVGSVVLIYFTLKHKGYFRQD